MIDKATVQRILDTADIVDVVSDYVHLVKRGANFMGLCPFHNEKTPSFSVSRNKNICHCFSCGKGGSPVNFIMEKEGINYHDALLHLAGTYGIKVEEKVLTEEELQRRNERESMLTVNEWAMKKMSDDLLNTEEGKNVGLTYLFERGVTMEAIKAFHLGYAIDKGNYLVKEAEKSGYDLETLCKVGLAGISSNNGKYYDRFRGRVIFPVMNSAGKVIAFGGRGIRGEAAKYVNSPESSLYYKSNELYGIYQARNAIVREKRCFLVEGYMDVIGMWQSGMENVVASSGTSLTEGQIALIHRFTDNVTLIYDGDAAGIKASLRGIDLLLSHKLNISVLLLPDGDDPDSFARKHTPEEFRIYVEENEKDFIDFEIASLTSEKDSPQQRSAAIETIVHSIACIEDAIKRQLYIQQTSQRLNIQEALLLTAVKRERIKVVDEIRKKRDFNRIRKENESVSTPASDAGANDRTKATENEQIARKDTNTPIFKDGNSKLFLLEKNILTYCIKYGLTDFCESIDETGSTKWLNVIEFIRNDMKADNVSFSSPLIQKIFDEVELLCEDYLKAREDFLKDIDREQESRIKEWYDSMAANFASSEEIESKEQELRDILLEERTQHSRKFAIDYSARMLASHIDDDVRKFALEVITPKYKLSNYHSKVTKIVPEEDRIEELIPRALCEWKDGLLEMKFVRAQSQLKAATLEGNSDLINESLKELNNISSLRRHLAKIIGERILSVSPIKR